MEYLNPKERGKAQERRTEMLERLDDVLEYHNILARLVDVMEAPRSRKAAIAWDAARGLLHRRARS
jgi:flagellar biosynthesis regulator FlbT